MRGELFFLDGRNEAPGILSCVSTERGACVYFTEIHGGGGLSPLLEMGKLRLRESRNFVKGTRRKEPAQSRARCPHWPARPALRAQAQDLGEMKPLNHVNITKPKWFQAPRRLALLWETGHHQGDVAGHSTHRVDSGFLGRSRSSCPGPRLHERSTCFAGMLKEFPVLLRHSYS